MIQFSYENFFLFILVSPIFIAIFSLAIYISYKNIQNISKQIKQHFSYKRKKQELDRKKSEEGFVHKWVDIAVGAKNVHVCQETGFCPSMNGFFPLETIDEILEVRKKDEEYQEFRKNEITRIGQEIGLGYEAMEDYTNKLIGIRTKFVVSKLEELRDGLKSKSE